MFNNKVILITGGTGSWANELSKQLLEKCPKKIIIFSRGELAQVNMQRKFNDSRLEYVIGDVRDKEAVEKVVARGVDYIFHMAALKHVPICENHPQEAIKTNIDGTTNIINASIKYKVKKVIDVSTDKACLDYFQTVELTDGKKRNIRDIVNNKEPLFVKSWDGEKFVPKKVVNWFKNKLCGRQMYRIRYEDAPKSGRNTSSVVVTEDHLILTDGGWLPAMEINTGDIVYTSDILFNEKQRAFILGTVLGDATLVKRNKLINRVFLKISHGEGQKEWVEHKYNCIKEVVNDIHRYTNKGGRKDSFNFITKTNLYLSELYDKTYINDKKLIPRDIVKPILYNPNTIGVFLATLFMDDGCVTDNLFRIATHGFTKEDVDWFSETLTELGYNSYTYGCTVGYTTYPELRFNREGSDKLAALIGPYLIESMRYKMQNYADIYTHNSSLWDMGVTKYLSSKITIERHHYRTPRDVYCIDIEDTHNFVSGGIVVHNCSPTNLYGFTKAVGEKLVIQANNLTDNTDFVCIRGGNVLGSNGSVVPLFIDQIKRFNKVTVTCGIMTRYFLTLPEAISLLFKASESSVGGETYVMNMPSFYISELAEVLIEHYGNSNTAIDEIGIREGEKMDEVLISEHESSRSYVLDDDYYIIKSDLRLKRDFSYMDSLPKVSFEKFSSSDNLKGKIFLKGLLEKGGFLI